MPALALALACIPQSVAPVQDAPQDWSELDTRISALPATFAPQNSAIDWGGFIKVSWARAENTATAGGINDIDRFAINNARLYASSSFAGWDVLIGLRGEADSGNGFFGDTATVEFLRAFEVLASREMFDEFGPLRDGEFHIGTFRPPFLGSALVDDNQLLFVNRTFNGERWDYYDTGASANSRLGPLRGWIAVQNGLIDGAGDDVALTLRGMWDVIGDGFGYEHEGALDAPEGFALSFGGAAFVDTTDNDAASQALEARMALIERVVAQAELVDNGDGLGDLYSWEATLSFLVTEDIELAARYADFERADDTTLWRFGINKYFRGHDVKVQLEVTDADSNAPRADVEVVQLGFVVSI